MARNYHRLVAAFLTREVRRGGTIETDAKGIRVCGLPSPSGAYATLYTIDADDGRLRRTETDEFGRTLMVQKMDDDGATFYRIVE